MYTTHRPSIIHRPVKPPSQSNVETVESQYEREQDYWRARASRFHDHQTRLNNSLYPTHEAKLAFHCELQAAMRQQELHRATCRLQQEEQEHQRQPDPGATQPAGHLPYQHHASPEHLQRPWAATTLAYSKHDEDAARRRHAEAVARENVALMEQRQHQRQQQVAAEVQQHRQAVQSEGDWWNLGAAGERWIPPEHRVRHRPAECRPPSASLPPWAFEGQPEAAAGCGQQRRQRAAPCGVAGREGQPQAAGAGDPQRPATAPKEYPWTWHT